MAVTLDSTFLFKTASNQDPKGKSKCGPLIEPSEIFEGAPLNSRVITLLAGEAGNQRDYPVLAHIDRDNEGFNIKFGVCYYNRNWHRLGYSKTHNRAPIVGKELDWLNESNYPDDHYTDKQKELFYSAGQAGQVSTSQKLGAIQEDLIADELSELFARTRISSMSQTTQTNI
jgi:hypothetical protein